jgi:hypothetical protein
VIDVIGAEGPVAITGLHRELGAPPTSAPLAGRVRARGGASRAVAPWRTPSRRATILAPRGGGIEPGPARVAATALARRTRPPASAT